MKTTRKQINQFSEFRTEADYTTYLDLQAWHKDNYGNYARKEISLGEYEARRLELLARMAALRLK